MFEVKKKAPQTERKNEGQTKEISTELMPKNYKISLLGSHLKIKESEIREVCTEHFCKLYGTKYLLIFTLSLLHHAKLYFSLSNNSIHGNIFILALIYLFLFYSKQKRDALKKIMEQNHLAV